MTKIRLKYVDAFTGRDGKPRHYFRRKPGPRIPLPGKPGSDEFMAAYKAALTGPACRDGAGKSIPGSFDDLCVRYYRSAGFLATRPVTQANYKRVIEPLRDRRGANGARFGDLQVAGMKGEHMKALLAAYAGKPGMQRALRKSLKLLFALAIEERMTATDPMAGIKAAKASGQGWRPLTAADFARYREHWPLGTRERLALELLFNTAGRREDARQLGRQHVVAGKAGREFDFTASKNEVVVAGIPVLPMTQAAIDACPVLGLDAFLVTRFGGPFTPQSFSNFFRDACAAAGLPKNSSPHGVRKGVLTQLAEDGATAHQIMAVAGHLTLQEAERYTKAAERKRMARAGMGTMSEQTFPNPDPAFGKSTE